MGSKLNQIIAVEKGIKTKTGRIVSDAHHTLKKQDLFNGHAKTFKPADEDPSKPTGEALPPDNMKVKFRVEEIIKKARNGWAELFNITAMRDFGNTVAKSDVVVDDTVVLENVPVTYLLFLEKQLDDLYTFVSKLPTLDPGEIWEKDLNQDMYATKPADTIRTKKMSRAFVLYEATTEHPAQVKEIVEDVLHGTWSTIKYSTALRVSDLNVYLEKVEKLQRAVKFAREKANEQEVDKNKIGEQLLKYVFD